MTVRCPAKVNLSLSVGPPDSSGFHPLRTVFQAVSLCDTLEVEPASADSFCCDSRWVPAENTVTRAWRLASEYVDLPPVRVSLTKRVPPESGLGGGSSDAAGLLRAFVALSRGVFRPQDAAEVAAAVGSDVPFFLVGGRARGEGRGEVLTPLPDAPRLHLVVVRPGVGVSTACAYAALDLVDRKSEPLASEDDPGWSNDFEAVAPEPCTEAKGRLLACGAVGALLCGSGSAVFGAFPSEGLAREAAASLAGHYPFVETCHTMTREESLWTS